MDGQQRVARVQLKADTGLSRNGATAADWPALVAAAVEAEAEGTVVVTGLWSHLACADEPSHPSVAVQLAAFDGFAVLDFKTHEEVARIKLPDLHTGVDMDPGREDAPSHGIGVSPDGKSVWVTSIPQNAVFAYNTSDLKLTDTIKLPDARWSSSRVVPAGSAHVYLDASGSMGAELPLLVALLGVVMERWFLRRFHMQELPQALLTFGFVFIIADLALVRGTGARGLRAILEDVLLGTMYELPGRTDVGRVVIDAPTVTAKAQPAMVPREPVAKRPRRQAS